MRVFRSAVPAAIVFAFAASPLATSSLAAQTSVLAGKWDIEYERGRTMQNGEVTSIPGKGTLTLSVAGDSVTAVLQGGPRPDGSPSPAVTMGGHLVKGSAVLITKRVARINENGEESTREVTVTWTLKADGDALSGTMLTVMANSPIDSDPSPVKGTRAKS